MLVSADFTDNEPYVIDNKVMEMINSILILAVSSPRAIPTSEISTQNLKGRIR